MIDNMTATAAQEGLDLRFDLARPGNTFDAHRLLHLALEHGQQDELKERLDAATFTEGFPASDHFALRALATQVGLPEVEVDAIPCPRACAIAISSRSANVRQRPFRSRPRRGRTPPDSRSQRRPFARYVPASAAAPVMNSPRAVAAQNV